MSQAVTPVPDFGEPPTGWNYRRALHGFLAETGLSKTRLGQNFCGDPNWYFQVMERSDGALREVRRPDVLWVWMHEYLWKHRLPYSCMAPDHDP